MFEVYQGLSYLALGEETRGRRLLRNVAESHPDTEAARIALKALGGSGGGA